MKRKLNFTIFVLSAELGKRANGRAAARRSLDDKVPAVVEYVPSVHAAAVAQLQPASHTSGVCIAETGYTMRVLGGDEDWIAVEFTKTQDGGYTAGGSENAIGGMYVATPSNLLTLIFD